MGLLVLAGVHRDDTEEDVDFLAKRIVKLRVFKDENNKINKSLKDVNGDVMIVSNFTLQAQLQSGMRPNFSRCADHELADRLYTSLVNKVKEWGVSNVQTGKFGEHMILDTVMDGPFNIIIDTKQERGE